MSRVWKSNQYKKSDRLEVAPLPIYTIDVIFFEKLRLLPSGPFLLRFLSHFSCFKSFSSFIFFHFPCTQNTQIFLRTYIRFEMQKTFFQHHLKLVEDGGATKNFRFSSATLDEIYYREKKSRNNFRWFCHFFPCIIFSVSCSEFLPCLWSEWSQVR